jgi:hypothetical protein
MDGCSYLRSSEEGIQYVVDLIFQRFVAATRSTKRQCRRRDSKNDSLQVGAGIGHAYGCCCRLQMQIGMLCAPDIESIVDGGVVNVRVRPHFERIDVQLSESIISGIRQKSKKEEMEGGDGVRNTQ